jgi:hypothetical protein
MKPKQIREIARLIREHFLLQADIRALGAILDAAVNLNQPPFGWLEALRLARLQPDYRNISEQLAPQLAELEQSLEASELVRLLENIPPIQFQH